MQLSGLHNKNQLFRLSAPNVHYIKLWVQPTVATISFKTTLTIDVDFHVRTTLVGRNGES